VVNHPETGFKGNCMSSSTTMLLNHPSSWQVLSSYHRRKLPTYYNYESIWFTNGASVGFVGVRGLPGLVGVRELCSPIPFFFDDRRGEVRPLCRAGRIRLATSYDAANKRGFTMRFDDVADNGPGG